MPSLPSPPHRPTKAPPVFLGLLRPRTCLLPTWRGWGLLILLAVALAIFLARNIYPFLAVQDSRPGGFLVVEGWVPDFLLEQAVKETQRHHYEGIIAVGEPIAQGRPLMEYGDYAQLTVATLKKLGADPAKVHPALVENVVRNRTFAKGGALGVWLEEHGQTHQPINLMSLGAHSRRSHMLIERALGRKIGVITVDDVTYDPAHWWRSSSGVRIVVGETIAYLYARFIFRPGS